MAGKNFFFKLENCRSRFLSSETYPLLFNDTFLAGIHVADKLKLKFVVPTSLKYFQKI